MILQIRCTKCNGNVMERDGLDGEEKLCLNCGFGQIAAIVPNQELADDSEDYQLRNRSDGWSDTYYDLHGTRGQSGKTNRPKRIDTRQTVTKETIETWNRINKELTS